MRRTVAVETGVGTTVPFSAGEVAQYLMEVEKREYDNSK